MSQDLRELQIALRRFAEERQWQQFHTPKNLAASISIEAAELLEHFQWLTDEQSAQIPQERLQLVGHEIADVLIYLLQISDKLGIAPIQAAMQKLEINAAKYPADKSRGNIKKYTEI